MTLWLWLAAAAPVAVLLVGVVSGRLSTRAGAAVALLVALALSVTAFEAGAQTAAVGVAKGAWLGLWILLVVWPALLLYQLVSAVGSDRIGEALSRVLPGRSERLLALAWVLPSFVQGVAGFGTPIAVAAPLLVALGWDRTRAVAYPLIGYHWSVTFGSMGSSYYVASLTAGFGHDQQAELALRASALLAVNCLVAGALLLLLDGGMARLREGGRTLLAVGIPMAVTLVGVATLIPAVATLAAAGVGFAGLWVAGARRRRRTAAPDASGAPHDEVHPALLLSPYLLLLVTALPTFLVPWSRDWVREHLLVGPTFAATSTGRGWDNAAVSPFNPVALLGHPGFYISLAGLLGYVTLRRAGLLRSGQGRHAVAAWARKLPASSAPILLLAAMAMLMVNAGMVSVLARGVADVAGDAYPALSPIVGAIGSFMTGSTTSSNALFAAFQGEVASLRGLEPTVLVAAQTAGGNVGNSLAPVVVLIGVTAVGAVERASAVTRMCLIPCGALLLCVAFGTFFQLLA